MTNEVEIALEAEKYDQRIKNGIKFSSLMNAELNLIEADFVTPEEMGQLKDIFNTDEDGVMELAKDEIDTAFEKTQWFLEGGKWKSAEREITKVNPSTFVKQTLIDRIKLSISTYNLTSYK